MNKHYYFYPSEVLEANEEKPALINFPAGVINNIGETEYTIALKKWKATANTYPISNESSFKFHMRHEHPKYKNVSLLEYEHDLKQGIKIPAENVKFIPDNSTLSNQANAWEDKYKVVFKPSTPIVTDEIQESLWREADVIINHYKDSSYTTPVSELRKQFILTRIAK